MTDMTRGLAGHLLRTLNGQPIDAPLPPKPTDIPPEKPRSVVLVSESTLQAWQQYSNDALALSVMDVRDMRSDRIVEYLTDAGAALDDAVRAIRHLQTGAA